MTLPVGLKQRLTGRNRFVRLRGMNPSRITTPLDKKIDEWWFRYLNLPLKFDVYLHRARDIEVEHGGKFESYFYAVPNRKSLERRKITEFPSERLQSATFEGLRSVVLKLINDWMNAMWEKVIVIYLEESKPQMNFDNTRMLTDHDVVKFDYVVCYKSKDSRFWKKADSTFVSPRIDNMLSTCGSLESFHAVPYTVEMEESLKILSEKLRVLACGLRQLVFQRTEDFITWARQSPQNLLVQ